MSSKVRSLIERNRTHSKKSFKQQKQNFRGKIDLKTNCILVRFETWKNKSNTIQWIEFGCV